MKPQKYKVTKRIPIGFESPAEVGDILTLKTDPDGYDVLYLDQKPVCDIDTIYGETYCIPI